MWRPTQRGAVPREGAGANLWVVVPPGRRPWSRGLVGLGGRVAGAAGKAMRLARWRRRPLSSAARGAMPGGKRAWATPTGRDRWRGGATGAVEAGGRGRVVDCQSWRVAPTITAAALRAAVAADTGATRPCAPGQWRRRRRGQRWCGPDAGSARRRRG